MKKFNSLTNRSGLVRWVILSVSVMLGVSSCHPDYNLDTEFPDWLGHSVYQTLQEGFEGNGGKYYHFNYFVRLIDSLKEKDVLDKTGSKTLFVADDEAFEKFFGPDCPFKTSTGEGVKSFDELSIAQMKMILYGSMLNNVYQVAALSTTGGSDNSDPVVGNCMRRVSASSYTDSIPIYHLADLPDSKHNPYWDDIRATASTVGVPILQDGTNRPIVFFVNKFLEMNGLTSDDYDFLFNQGKYPIKNPTGKKAREANEASVNGIMIEYQNKKCFNGFLHVMSDVVYLLPNMAEYLSQNSSQADASTSTGVRSTIYSSIIERFAAPYSDPEMTTNIKKLIDDGYLKSPALKAALEDQNSAVYIKRYFSENNRAYADGAKPLTTLPNGKSWDQQQSVLRFDPGWNGYFTPVPGSGEENAKLLQHNMAVMLVPTDEAIKKWWLFEDGKTMRSRYGKQEYKNWDENQLKAMTYRQVADDMDSIPYKVISKLVNNNMLYSLVGSVPSKFATVLNDANDPMFEGKVLDDNGNEMDGIQAAIESVDSVVMCCNGAIYFTNKVYAPTAYRSVSYPTLVNEKLDIINMAIENKTLSFSAYLNSMVSTYSLFVPEIRDATTEGIPEFQNKLVCIDPLSFQLNADTAAIQVIVFRYDYEKNTIIADWYPYNYRDNAVTGKSLQTLEYKAPEKLNDAETAASQIIMNRLGDLLDYHIIIGDIEKDNSQTNMNDYRYFQTKGRGTVRVKTVADMEHNFGKAEVAGGWQIEQNEKINIIDRKDFSKTGNGRTYIIDRPLATSRRSAYDVLSDSINYPEFKMFFKLMENAAGRKKASKGKNPATKKAMFAADGKFLFDSKMNSHAIGSEKNITTLNTFHYTLYVPDSTSLKALLDNHTIFSEDSLAQILKLYNDSTTYWSKTLKLKKAEYEILQEAFRKRIAEKYGRQNLLYGAISDDKKYTKEEWYKDPEYLNEFIESERTRLKNFLKYHIQDNSVYANAPFNAGKNDDGSVAKWAKYETAFMDDGEFTRLTVSGGTEVYVQDDKGNTHKVSTNEYSKTHAPLWNIMCREYEFDKATITAATTSDSKIETSSYVVIHQINGALIHPTIEKR